MTDHHRDAAIRALCDFAEQPHPGRAGEALDALERHLSPHPAPPPSPSEENAGEGAGSRGFDATPDQDVTEVWALEVNFDGYGYRPDELFATEALANEALEKFRGGGIANARVTRWTTEASADAATIAGLLNERASY